MTLPTIVNQLDDKIELLVDRIAAEFRTVHSRVSNTLTSGEDISGHVAVTVDSSGLARRADCRNPLHAQGVVGVSVGFSATGTPCTIRYGGLLENPGWGLTPDQPVFLGELGALVQTLPPSALFCKSIGLAKSASSVLIDIQPAIFLPTS